jgi:hypothetical protein
MKESGIGRENGLEAFESCTLQFAFLHNASFSLLLYHLADSQSKSTIVNIASSDETRWADDWFADGGDEKRYG